MDITRAQIFGTKGLERVNVALPGQCFFVEYPVDGGRRAWIGIICDESMLNEEMRKERPKGAQPQSGSWTDNLISRVYPVMILGTNLRRWIPVSQIYELSDQQVSLFKDATEQDSFKSLLGIAKDRRNDLPYWKTVLSNSNFRLEINSTLKEKAQQEKERNGTEIDNGKRRLDQDPIGRAQERETSGLFVSDAEDDDVEELGEATEKSNGRTQPAHKRARTGPSNQSPALSQMNSLFTSTDTPSDSILDTETLSMTTASDVTSFIKIEAGSERPRQEAVRVQVGPNHSWVNVAKRHIAQSPFLAQNIHERPGKQAYIMLPEFVDISTEDFAAVKSFLGSGDYRPRLVQQRRARTAWTLEGMLDTDRIGQELVRCGRIYGLATEFELPDLQALVMKKLRSEFPERAAPKHFLALAKLVFDKNWAHRARDDYDDLRRWIVEFAAKNFRRLNEAGTRQFWEVMEAHHDLQAAVFKFKSDLLQENVIVIKDED